MRVRTGATPVPSADVAAGGLTASTDERGEARLALPPGDYTVTAVRAGFAPGTADVRILEGEAAVVTIQLREQRLEDRVTVVSSTRTGTLIEDQPIRVEAVPQEEIEENSTISPGTLTTLLNELGGLRVQTSVPSLAGAELRLQGLRGRYTAVLTDELPLAGAPPDPFDLIQVPPLDLAHVEVIKGTASALYGGSALGGVVNLVSQRPGGEPGVLLSQTSHGGTDLAGFVPHDLGSGWGYTLLGSAHRQSQEDLDGDGWADLPGYRRGTLRPRLYWDDGTGHSLFATIGAMAEDREGGTVAGAVAPDGLPYADTLRTRRIDGGFVGRFLLGGERLLQVHASATGTRHERHLGDAREEDTRDAGSLDVSLGAADRGHTWVVGAALAQDRLGGTDQGRLDYRYLVPALFAQDEYAPSERLSIAAGLRADFHNVYGTFVSPLLSVLVRPAPALHLRLSAGTGFAAPVPFTDRTEEVGLSRVLPIDALDPERAASASVDLGWSRGGLELSGTLFASRVRDALLTRDSTTVPGSVELVNAPEPTETSGSELIVHYERGAWELIATHTHLRSVESDPAGTGRRLVPLTPADTADLDVIFESEERGRVGAEVSYTGAQHLEDDPYRDVAPATTQINLLGEIRFGEVRVFLNALNVTGVRQTAFDPLLLPAQAPDGRWTTDVWAPLDGRVFNAGVRLEF